MLEAVGVVYLSKGVKQVGEPKEISATEIVRLVGRGLCNGNIWVGLLFETVFFAGLLILMSQSDVSFLWPLTSLGFVITTVAAQFILHERVSGLRWAGVCLIMIGAGIITWSEHTKPKPQSASPPPTPVNSVSLK